MSAFSESHVVGDVREMVPRLKCEAQVNIFVYVKGMWVIEL